MIAKRKAGDLITDRFGNKRQIIAVHAGPIEDDDGEIADGVWYDWQIDGCPEVFDSRNCADNCEFGWSIVEGNISA